MIQCLKRYHAEIHQATRDSNEGITSQALGVTPVSVIPPYVINLLLFLCFDADLT